MPESAERLYLILRINDRAVKLDANQEFIHLGETINAFSLWKDLNTWHKIFNHMKNNSQSDNKNY